MSSTFTVYHDIDDLQGLRNAWEPLQWNPYSDIDSYIYQHKVLNTNEKPYVIAINHGKEVSSLLVGSLAEKRFQFQLGYKQLLGPNLRILTIRGWGLLGPIDLEDQDLLQQAITSALDGDADIVILGNIPLVSKLGEMKFDNLPVLCRDFFRWEQEHWQLALRDTFASFLLSHKQLNRNYTKYRNRIWKTFSTIPEIRCYCSENDSNMGLEQTEAISIGTWQRQMDNTSFLDPEVRKRYSFLVRKGWLRIYILYIGNVPASFVHGCIYNSVLYLEQTGYKQTYRNYGVGTLLMMEIIKKAHEGDAIRTLDFNAGNSEAKRLLCDLPFRKTTLTLFGPAHQLQILNCIRSAARVAHLLAQRVLRKAGGYQQVRKHLRHQG